MYGIFCATVYWEKSKFNSVGLFRMWNSMTMEQLRRKPYKKYLTSTVTFKYVYANKQIS